MRNRFARAPYLIMGVTLLAASATRSAEVTLEEGVFEPTGQTCLIVETPFLRATIVPDAGGRILRLVDRRTNAQIVYAPVRNQQAQGGLLDDKYGREIRRYDVDVLEQTPETLRIRLSLRDDEKNVHIAKTLTFHADTPLVEIDYTYTNASQDKVATNPVTIRNRIIPTGEAVTEADRFFVPTTKTVRSFGAKYQPGPMPELKQKFRRAIGAPWHAMLNVEEQKGVAFYHLDEGYSGWYFWKGGVDYPTYEWVHKGIPAGKEATYRTRMVLVHGFESLVDVTRDYLLDVRQVETDGGPLSIEIRAAAVRGDLGEIRVDLRLEDFSGTTVANPPPVTLSDVTIDRPVNAQTTVDAPGKGHYLLRGIVQKAGRRLGTFEKVVSVNAGHFVDADYKREIEYPTEARIVDIPGWVNVRDREIAQPTDAVRDRFGYMLYSEVGPDAGKPLDKLTFDLLRGEFQSVRIVYYPLTEEMKMVSWGPSEIREAETGRVVKTPPEARIEQIERFRAERIGREDPQLMHKLVPNARFDGIEKQFLWLTLDTRGLDPGTYLCRLFVNPDNKRQTSLPVEFTVLPVDYPHGQVHLEVEYYLGSLGNWDTKRDALLRYFDDLGTHHVDHLMAVPRDFQQHARVEGTDKSLRDFMRSFGKADRENLASYRIDYSAYDPLIAKAREHGLVRFKTSFYSTELAEPYDWWQFRELNRYLRARGYEADSIFVKILDEQPAEKYPVMAKVGADMRDIGWIPFTTVSTLIAEPDNLKILAPVFGMFQGHYSDPDVVAKRRAEGLLTPEHEIWEYVGSGTSALPYSTSIEKGWYIAWHALDGFHIHEYNRGGGSRLSALAIFPTPQGPLSSPAWEGWRDGIEIANMFRYAQNKIKNADEEGSVAQTSLAQWRKKLDAIVSPSEEAIITLEPRRVPGGVDKYLPVDFTLDKAAKARSALLDLLVEMK